MIFIFTISQISTLKHSQRFLAVVTCSSQSLLLHFARRHQRWEWLMQDHNRRKSIMEAQVSSDQSNKNHIKNPLVDPVAGSQVLQEDFPVDKGPGKPAGVRRTSSDQRWTTQDGNAVVQSCHHLTAGGQMLPRLRRSLWVAEGRGFLDVCGERGSQWCRDTRVLLLPRYHSLCWFPGSFLLPSPTEGVSRGQGCPHHQEPGVLAEINERDNLPGEGRS